MTALLAKACGIALAKHPKVFARNTKTHSCGITIVEQQNARKEEMESRITNTSTSPSRSQWTEVD